MKRITVITLVLLAFSFPLRFVRAQAYVPGLRFGGHVRTIIPCICSFNMWTFYAPLYPIPPFPGAGPLVVMPGVTMPRAYQWFVLPVPVPTTWQLGQYVPPGICLLLIPSIPPVCLPLPAFGMVTMAGASFPGFP
jgi:hypothetical protein